MKVTKIHFIIEAFFFKKKAYRIKKAEAKFEQALHDIIANGESLNRKANNMMQLEIMRKY